MTGFSVRRLSIEARAVTNDLADPAPARNAVAGGAGARQAGEVSKTVPVGYHGFEFWVYDVSASILFAQTADVIAETPKKQRSRWLSALKLQLRAQAVLGADQYISLGEWCDGHEEDFCGLLAEAARRLKARGRITAEEAAAWIVCDRQPVIWRGREFEETAPAVALAETLDAIVRGHYPRAPAGYRWYFGAREVSMIASQ